MEMRKNSGMSLVRGALKRCFLVVKSLKRFLTELDHQFLELVCWLQKEKTRPLLKTVKGGSPENGGGQQVGEEDLERRRMCVEVLMGAAVWSCVCISPLEHLAGMSCSVSAGGFFILVAVDILQDRI